MNKIGIDAGHGGAYTGTYSVDTQKDKLYEKHYALRLAKLVRDILQENGFTVVMTRESDIRPGDVSQRAMTLANAGCDYAVSLHFNGVTNPAANGCEVFVPYASEDGRIAAGYQKYLGKFFAIRAPFARSNDLKDRNATFDKKLDVANGKFKAAKSKQDYFGFIRTGWQFGMRADLLEVCFLTNRVDFDTYVKNEAAIAEAIARAIIDGFGKKWSVPESPATVPDHLYRVGKYWANGKCAGQIGAYRVLTNATAACPTGYRVYDETGKIVFRRMSQENRR